MRESSNIPETRGRAGLWGESNNSGTLRMTVDEDIRGRDIEMGPWGGRVSGTRTLMRAVFLGVGTLRTGSGRGHQGRVSGDGDRDGEDVSLGRSRMAELVSDAGTTTTRSMVLGSGLDEIRKRKKSMDFAFGRRKILLQHISHLPNVKHDRSLLMRR